MEAVKLSDLTEQLINDIKSDNDFFKPKIILVPSKKIEAYVKSYFLKNKNDVLANIKFVNIKKGLYELFDTNCILASKNQMISIIMDLLKKNNIPDVIKNYLNNSSNIDLSSIKIYDAASKITELFIEYEKDLYPFGDFDNLYNAVINNLAPELTTLYQLYNNDTRMYDLGKIYVFGLIKYSNLELAILKKYSNYNEYMLKNTDIEYTDFKNEIMKAPSKLREIEILHSKICKILIEDKYSAFSDFLVIGTNVCDYESEIKRVFIQENKEYPNIPFYINASRTFDNSTYNAFIILKEIINKSFFTRYDLIKLLQNNMIKKSRNIDDEDIISWERAILNMNIFRKEDWKYAKTRYLASKIIDINSGEIINIDNEFYLPFSNGISDDSINRFILIVDDLFSVINTYKNNNLEELEKEFEKWFSIKDYSNSETNKLFIKIKNIISFINDKKYDISNESVLYLIQDELKTSIGNKGSLFSSGISFTNFDVNTITPAKYVFIIGASADNLPIIVKNNPLSNSNKKLDDGLDVFNLYVKNIENLYISFVYKNLETGDEFFLTPFVKSKFNTKKLEEELETKIKTISIDETRKENDIYTLRAAINKQFYDGLLDFKSIYPSKLNVSEHKKSDSFTVSQIADFLTEPLSYKVSQLFGKLDDEEELKKEYEIFDIDNLTRSIIFKEIVNEFFNNNFDKDSIKEKQRLLNRLPKISNILMDRCFDSIYLSASKFYDKNKNYHLLKINDCLILYKDNNWEIKGDDILIDDSNAEEINIVIITESSKLKFSLRGYVLALLYICQFGDGKEYSFIINGTYKINEMNKTKAINLLNNIYEAINNYSDNTYVNAEDLFSDDEEFDYNKVIKRVNDIWGYFDYKKLFDINNDLGFNLDDFDYKYGKLVDNHSKLIEMKKISGGKNND